MRPAARLAGFFVAPPAPGERALRPVPDLPDDPVARGTVELVREPAPVAAPARGRSADASTSHQGRRGQPSAHDADRPTTSATGRGLGRRASRDPAPAGSSTPAAPRVCVLGGDRVGVAVAGALARQLARRPGARAALVVRTAPAAAPARGVPGPSTPAARRLQRELALDDLPARVRGRVVDLEAALGAEALDRVGPHAVDVPVVTVLDAVRCEALDAVVGTCDVVVAIVAAGAPPALSALARAELQRLAPTAAVHVVAAGPRLGPAARRAAVAHVLGAPR